MRYKAFISYSHSDERWGTRLHKRLENFRIPKRLIGRNTERGPVPTTLRPIFRDKVELSAGANLSAALQKRLKQSEFLVVLCSPNAAKSFWVNEEILYFKQHNDPDNIFAFIIDGEPYSNHPDQECFPEALRFKLGAAGELTETRADPLAADARTKAGGPRAALLRLVSGMLGLGFDDLVRRDLQRARRRVTGITVSAISGMLAMGALTGIAMDARSEAEARKNDAEGLIEFMLTDLRDKLEPVGRLDVLDAVGQKASDYYNQYELENLAADDIGRHATANQLLGDIQVRLGNIAQASDYFDLAFEITKDLLNEDPDNPERIFQHAQSAYWKSVPLRQNEQLADAESYRQIYADLAHQYAIVTNNSPKSLLENAYAQQGLGVLSNDKEHFTLALEYFQKSNTYFEQAIQGSSPSEKLLVDYANNLSWTAGMEFQMGNIEQSWELRKKALSLSEEQLRLNPTSYLALTNVAAAQIGVGNLALYSEDTESALFWFIEAKKNVAKLLTDEPENKFVRNLEKQIQMRHDFIKSQGDKP